MLCKSLSGIGSYLREVFARIHLARCANSVLLRDKAIRVEDGDSSPSRCRGATEKDTALTMLVETLTSPPIVALPGRASLF